LIGFHEILPSNPFSANLIRAYYYDAIVDSEEKKEYQKQREYLRRTTYGFSITPRLGRLVRSGKEGYRQKGVDILMSIDALTMAFRNYYDTGLFFVGDTDFTPLIEAVKEVGKKTWILSRS